MSFLSKLRGNSGGPERGGRPSPEPPGILTFHGISASEVPKPFVPTEAESLLVAAQISGANRDGFGQLLEVLTTAGFSPERAVAARSYIMEGRRKRERKS